MNDYFVQEMVAIRIEEVRDGAARARAARATRGLGRRRGGIVNRTLGWWFGQTDKGTGYRTQEVCCA